MTPLRQLTFLRPLSPHDQDQSPNRLTPHHPYHTNPPVSCENIKSSKRDPSSGIMGPLPESHVHHGKSQALSHTLIAPSVHYLRLRSPSPDKEPRSSYQSQGTLAERRHHLIPSHLALQNSQSVRNPIVPAQMMPIPRPLEARTTAKDYEWDSESVYSEPDDTNTGMSDNPVFHGYCAWKDSSCPIEDTANPSKIKPFDTEASGNILGVQEPEGRVNKGPKSSLYSPLTPFFVDKGAPGDKKGAKTMFGQNGWLERTGKFTEKKDTPPKKSMFRGLKNIARDLVSLTIPRERGRTAHIAMSDCSDVSFASRRYPATSVHLTRRGA